MGTADRIRYSVLRTGQLLVDNATLSLDVDRTVLGLDPKVRSAKRQSVDRVVEPAVPRKAARLSPQRLNGSGTSLGSTRGKTVESRS